MKFKSRKDILFNIIVIGTCTLLFGIIIFIILTKKIELYEYLILLLVLGVTGIWLWTFLGTNYELSPTEFIFRSGPFARKIQISRIKEIIVGKTLWIGNWPTTARNGLLIKYDTHGWINISPKTNKSFVKKILELNTKIKIRE